MSRKPNLLTIGWALVILILCGIPGRDIPHFSFLEILSFDKWVHAGIFLVLTLLAVRGFRLQHTFMLLNTFAVIFALVFCIIYGGLLEVMQGTLFAERSADVYDFIANSFGCILAALIYPIVSRWFPKFNFPLHG
ncbi:MAG: VanZ family protein [Bacteroidota bacterium]|nr:VanZ family protein [Bacteroidota bacterium]